MGGTSVIVIFMCCNIVDFDTGAGIFMSSKVWSGCRLRSMSGGVGEVSISRQEKGFEVGPSGEVGCWVGCCVS